MQSKFIKVMMVLVEIPQKKAKTLEANTVVASNQKNTRSLFMVTLLDLRSTNN